MGKAGIFLPSHLWEPGFSFVFDVYFSVFVFYEFILVTSIGKGSDVRGARSLCWGGNQPQVLLIEGTLSLTMAWVAWCAILCSDIALINYSFIDTSFPLVVGTTSIKNNQITHSRMSITKWINFKTLELVHATHLPHGIHSVFQAYITLLL